MTFPPSTMIRELWPKASGPVVIGMIHLEPLPGAPRLNNDLPAIRRSALRDAAALVQGGVHGIMIENFGDVPFFPGRVPAETVAHMTAIVSAVRGEIGGEVPLGVNVLRNDGLSALAIAQAAGASFIRVNVLCGARVADQGILQGIAHDLLRLRSHLRAEGIRIFADVDVKHSAPLSGVARPLADEVHDTLDRGLADALIVSGAGTGRATDATQVQSVKRAAGEAPVFVGSGATAQTVREFLPGADGFIIGSSLKRDGVLSNPVDRVRVAELMAVFKA